MDTENMVVSKQNIIGTFTNIHIHIYHISIYISHCGKVILLFLPPITLNSSDQAVT